MGIFRGESFVFETSWGDKRMSRLLGLLTLSVVIGAIVSCSAEVEAGRGRWFRRHHPPVVVQKHPHPADFHPPVKKSKHHAYAPYHVPPRYSYPKYYGGFHQRYFDSIGIPSGDIGLRGNGIYATPW